MDIANPIYDTVFKYMMEDNTVAKLLVSSIIGEDVVSLDPIPQEYFCEEDKEKYRGEIPNLTVFHLGFFAKIKLADGQHKVIAVKIQKAELPSDIMRFGCNYVEQYVDSVTSLTNEERINVAQIYVIYFLDKELGIYDTPVLSVFPEMMDVSTGETVHSESSFFEGLHHKSWIVQISCLKARRRNELERLLSVFDQSNRTSDIHILNIREEDYPEKYRPVIRRLKGAASDSTVKKQMKEEDEVIKYLRDYARIAVTKALREAAETLREAAETLKEKDKTIEKKDKTIESLRKELEKLQGQFANQPE